MKLPSMITFVGYRMWEVTSECRLYAVMSDYEWPARQPAESTPIDLGEGFHAWMSPHDAWKALGEMYDDAPHLYLAVGSVALWGKVCWEDDTLRATRAYPLELWTTFDGETNGYVNRAAQRYGLDVVALPLEIYEVA
jgi:hypothetical protein